MDSFTALDEHIAAHVAELFRAFSDTSRVRILSALIETDYEHEDDFVPFALKSANAANTFAPKTIAADFLAFSHSITHLLPFPGAA